MPITFPEVKTDEDVALTAGLAKEIWTEHYTPIIGAAQVEYMLANIQSEAAIRQQIDHERFLYFLLEQNGEPVGYIGVQLGETELFLSKIYVRGSERRKGLGGEAVRFVTELARKRGMEKISLTVNKHNTAAIRSYEKLGFENLGSTVKDIGGGFVMDDYRMELAL
ncbi:MAG: GNAT family N-acetyltransferase [Gammaproteobacteria bacterium]|nr:GNAT family N-acetyltransferase [Gammaproteobacteria bacterium]